MNDDRCYHIPMSPGQSMCACKDYQMGLELTIELLVRENATLKSQSDLIRLLSTHIRTLENRLQKHEAKVLTIAV
jgi:hypothetical protein